MQDCDLMPDLPDYRSKKMESLEGRGIAWYRRYAWEQAVPEDALDAAFGRRSGLGGEIAKHFEARAKEFAELVGFWVAWHQSGGFEGLEMAGWNRATIFRKIRRFRAEFEMHPDEYRFSWIKLDLEKVWWSELERALGVESKSDR